ncbi:ribonuclease [Flavobacterium columnare]|uniref:Ribonuclease Z n=1 Tax=Flavobacterium columnare (strain ATCC 49512 / CIP 103533 / TG 44/87) TaxID=1041826 RepID=G8X7B5_FLACA|nr:ribonuclease Z [Flavobacterium columnare]AEW84929.1 ribonuclease Z [Flavobacterium columnare ATCC 49512]ANO48200.1 ribonuclease Z [Flavobacterium columnare]APT21235.1 ribonuclease Z [Flavobacterium columnare]MBF6653586.1 ribonuclease Z [Flavobacterium columnare]MBF6655377.1 ribonuclease Z [Flavobacterium columnare]
MNLTILGCYAATPRTFTNPTSQVLEINNRLFLIDCGEGTQTQLRKKKIRFTAINQIFISHLHGDHFYGLIGLISTFSLLNRHNPLTIYGPVGIKEVIKLQLRLANSWPQYELNFVELKSKKSEIIYEDKKVIVRTIPLKHRVYTNGFLFTEKTKERKLNIDKVQEYGIESCYFQNIKNGRDITLDDGRVLPNHILSFDPPKPKSYAFCSDTQYDESIVPLIKDVQILYHESTFLNAEEHLAEKTMHSTAKQAALIAKQANVEKLILGHYSTRYESIKLFKKEAELVFKNVLLGDDGANFEF